MKTKNILCGFFGGVVLYIPCCFAGYISYLSVSSRFGNTLLVGSLLISGLISVAVIAYKYHSIKYSLYRTGSMLLSIILTFLFNVWVGVIQQLDKMLHIGERNSEDMAFGLGMCLVFVAVFFVSVAVNVIIPIWRLIKGQDST